MTPTELKVALCRKILKRLESIGVTQPAERDRCAIELLAGAQMALNVLSDNADEEVNYECFIVAYRIAIGDLHVAVAMNGVSVVEGVAS